MFRSVVIPLVFLALLEVAFATTIDVSKTKYFTIQFTENDVASEVQLKNLLPKMYDDEGFIGDLEIGQRRFDETISQRIVTFNNPTNSVQSSLGNLQVSGTIHYLRIRNLESSYAVVCEQPNSLGPKGAIISVRVSANSENRLLAVIASH